MTDAFARSALCLTLAAATTVGWSQDIETLTVGVPIEQALAPGQEHHYRIVLPAGQFAEITVEQQTTPIYRNVFRSHLIGECYSILVLPSHG